MMTTDLEGIIPCLGLGYLELGCGKHVSEHKQNTKPNHLAK